MVSSQTFLAVWVAVVPFFGAAQDEASPAQPAPDEAAQQTSPAGEEVEQEGMPPVPPAERTRRRRADFPQWRSLEISGDAGYIGVAGDLARDYEAGGGAWASIYYRPLLFLSMGATVGAHGLAPTDPDLADELAIYLAGVSLRGHVPLSPWAWHPWFVQLWLGLMGGFVGLEFRDYIYTADLVLETMQGGFVGFTVGADIYATPWFSFGTLLRVIRPFYSRQCFADQCYTGEIPNQQEDLFIYFGLSATLHLYFYEE